MTLRDTIWTLADAKATAVSAITSAFTEPRPPVALAWKIQNHYDTSNKMDKMKRCWEEMLYSWNNWTGNSKYYVYFWIKFSIWETAHQPLPLPNINPNLLLVDCRWVKGGVGTQLLGCGHWSRFPYPPRPHNPPPPQKKNAVRRRLTANWSRPKANY